MRPFLAALVATMLAGFLSAARAAGPTFDAASEPSGVIQNRKYDLLHEITLLGGGLPADPYYKGISATVGYTLHVTDFVAWELAQATYVYGVDTKLKKEVLRLTLASGDDEPLFPQIDWVVASHLVVKPFYGKQALFNTKVLHVEGFAQLGPALVSRTDERQTELAYGVDVGIGVRLWLTRAISLRLDMGELVYFPEQRFEQAMRLHVGLAFNLRGAYE